MFISFKGGGGSTEMYINGTFYVNVTIIADIPWEMFCFVQEREIINCGFC